MSAHNKNPNMEITLSTLFLFILPLAGSITYYLSFFKENLNKPLPMTYTVESGDKDFENIAYHLWLPYMQHLTGKDASSWKRLTITGVRFKRTERLKRFNGPNELRIQGRMNIHFCG